MDASVVQFLDNLQKSNLLVPERLAEVRQAAAAGADPQALARDLVEQGRLTRWQAAQVLAGRTGFQLGKYRLLELLGRGGMGHVFLAQHLTMNRRVALKLLSRGLDRNPAAMERFLAEARAVASLDHPNIVQAYSVDNEGDRWYLVMEYVEGQDLQQMVEEKGPLSYNMAADAIRQAAEGLAHAHRRNMIHCDIKPSNLLVNQQGVVKILDMGLARLNRGPQEAPPAGDDKVLGTVDYLAPEQALGTTFDHRADIYSLGCTLYFLLTGQAPFPEGTLAERIVKHQTEPPPSILDKRPDAPRELARICRKMMAKIPAERFPWADDVSRALGELNPAGRELRRAVPLDQAKQEEPFPDLGLPEPGTPRPAVQAPKTAKPGLFNRPRLLVIGGAVASVAVLIIVAAVAMTARPGAALKKTNAPATSAPAVQGSQKPGAGPEKPKLPGGRWAGLEEQLNAPVQPVKGGFGSQGPPIEKYVPKPMTVQSKPKTDDKKPKKTAKPAAKPAAAADKEKAPAKEQKPPAKEKTSAAGQKEPPAKDQK